MSKPTIGVMIASLLIYLNACKTVAPESSTKQLTYEDSQNVTWLYWTEAPKQPGAIFSVCRGECQPGVDLSKLEIPERIRACSRNLSGVRVSSEHTFEDPQMNAILKAMASPKVLTVEPEKKALFISLLDQMMKVYSGTPVTKNPKIGDASFVEPGIASAKPCIAAQVTNTLTADSFKEAQAEKSPNVDRSKPAVNTNERDLTKDYTGPYNKRICSCVCTDISDRNHSGGYFARTISVGASCADIRGACTFANVKGKYDCWEQSSRHPNDVENDDDGDGLEDY